LGDKGVAGRMILKCIFKKSFYVGRIHLDQGKVQYHAIVSIVMNPLVPSKAGIHG
jgi:hypothetical protein